ncbi:MAG TPA: cell wall-binding repeat-containing protein [Solirubrobacterales bacterium]|nr:cell wall-binding repeat-containing protein [Solirubrobacterales bacterium]
MPAALKGIVGLVVLALVFIVAAILGGRGDEDEAPSTPAPPPVAAGEAEAESASQTAAQLGYPTFATNNTTRIGGGDAASNAAAVALAVYPSADATTQPDAVALVDAARWQDAVAAAVLMAAPVRAPLLLSSASGPPEATEQALAALDPQGSARTNGAKAFAVGAAQPADGLETTPVGGGEPVATAAAIATLRDRLAGKPPAHIVIASVEAPEFAAPAAAWAARSGDPVLFATKDNLPAATATALRRHPAVPVYVLGPTAAISSPVVRAIAKAGGEVRRVSGEDPVTSAIALARYDDGNFGWNVNDPGHGFVIARSDSPLDAAVAAPLSASGTWGPLLLTDSADTLPAALRDYMLDVKPGYTTDPTRAFYNHVWVVGDEEAIGVSQQAEIDELAELAKAGGEP